MLETRTTEMILHHACRASWWFRAVTNVPLKRTPAQKRGTCVHKALELAIGEGVDVGNRLANALLDRMPTPEDVAAGTVLVERNWRMVFADIGTSGVGLRGTCDLLDLRAMPEILGVGDHKTSSNVDEWGLTSWDMADNWQTLTYALAARDVLGFRAETYRVAHHYMDTRPTDPDAPVLTRVVPCDIGNAELDAHLMAIRGELASMARTAEVKNPADLLGSPTDRARCRMYGGCPYAGRCPHAAKRAHERAEQKESKMPVVTWQEAARLKREKAAAEQAALFAAPAGPVIEAQVVPGAPKRDPADDDLPESWSAFQAEEAEAAGAPDAAEIRAKAEAQIARENVAQAKPLVGAEIQDAADAAQAAHEDTIAEQTTRAAGVMGRCAVEPHRGLSIEYPDFRAQVARLRGRIPRAQDHIENWTREQWYALDETTRGEWVRQLDDIRTKGADNPARHDEGGVHDAALEPSEGVKEVDAIIAGMVQNDPPAQTDGMKAVAAEIDALKTRKPRADAGQPRTKKEDLEAAEKRNRELLAERDALHAELERYRAVADPNKLLPKHICTADPAHDPETGEVLDDVPAFYLFLDVGRQSPTAPTMHYVHLDDLTKPLKAKIEAEWGVAHYALSERGLAGGAAAVAAMIVSAIPRGHDCVGIIVNTFAPCAAACLEKLRPLAADIFGPQR
ncbi:MAG: PD-(D/E)XK nuclease family protein [Gemmatimonadaceae bacterium]|jgi:hypothetical protein